MTATILSEVTLPDLPSASGVEIVGPIAYVVSDDAPYLYLLDAATLAPVGQVELFAGADFVGTLNNGDLSIAVSRNANGSADAGWALLGNPYPAPIDLSRTDAQTQFSSAGLTGPREMPRKPKCPSCYQEGHHETGDGSP